MGKLKDVLKDRFFARWGIFIIFTGVTLYILFFVVKNFNHIFSAIAAALGSVFSALTPLFIGLVIAYLLSPLVDIIDQRIMAKVFFKLPQDPFKQEKRKNIRRLVSILLTFLLIIAVVCLIISTFALLIGEHIAFTSFQEAAENVIQYFLKYEGVVKEWAASLPQQALGEKIDTALNSVTSWFSDNLNASTLVGYVAGVGGSLVNLALGAIVSIYLLKDKPFFFSMWRKLLHLTLSQKTNAIVSESLREINGVFSHFIRGALLDALIIAVLSSVGLSLLGLNSAVFIGCFAGICNVIPYFGPILGMIPAFIVGMFTEGFSQGILAVVILLIIQQIDANIIYPKIVGATTGLHPLFVLLAVTVAGYFGGILYMIIAVPIAGVLQVFVLKWAEWMDRRKDAKSAAQ